MFTSGLIGGVGGGSEGWSVVSVYSGLIGGVGGGREWWSVVSVYLGIDWRGWGG